MWVKMVNVVKNTWKKLYKSIAKFKHKCYSKDSQQDEHKNLKRKTQWNINNKKFGDLVGNF